jgi:hypothetical protein
VFVEATASWVFSIRTSSLGTPNEPALRLNEGGPL